MWILTQNGTRILSTEGMDEIYVSAPIEGKTDHAVMLFKKRDGKPFALGFYCDKKRAVRALEEIFAAQAYFAPYQENIVIPPKVYRMPPDDEMAFTREFVIEKEQAV